MLYEEKKAKNYAHKNICKGGFERSKRLEVIGMG